MAKLVKLNDKTAVDLDDIVCALAVENEVDNTRRAVRVYFKTVSDVMVLYDEAASALMGAIPTIAKRRPAKEARAVSE